jgi:valyl-tRNA synthetase
MGFCGKVDIQKEEKRLTETKKELIKIKNESLKKLHDENFLARASEEVIQEHKDRVVALSERIDRFDYVLKSLKLI